jgi:hypothetical protein
MCIERAFGMLKGRWRILLKRIDVALKNVPNLVSTCLMLHNICIVFGDEFWRAEWMQEATDEVHHGITAARVSGTSTSEKMAVANHALENLAWIDENSRETLKYYKQETAKHFEIAMSNIDKTPKELSARRNSIVRSLWMVKYKASIAETFTNDNEWKHMCLQFFYKLLHCLLYTHQ